MRAYKNVYNSLSVEFNLYYMLLCPGSTRPISIKIIGLDRLCGCQAYLKIQISIIDFITPQKMYALYKMSARLFININ